MNFGKMLEKIHLEGPNGWVPFKYDFYRGRIEKNKAIKLSECSYQRQTGRTTFIVLATVHNMIFTENFDVVFYTHNYQNRDRIARIMKQTFNQLGIVPTLMTPQKIVLENGNKLIFRLGKNPREIYRKAVGPANIVIDNAIYDNPR